MAGALTDRIDRRLRLTEDAIETEVRRTRSEARAFKNFTAKVRELDSQTPTEGTAGTMVQTVTVSRPGTQRRLREAYETTVMNVPHYEEDYGDSFQESFTAEFGEPISKAVMQGSSVDDRQQQLLLAKSREARRDRLEFADVLETERESVRKLSKRVWNFTAEMEILQEEAAAAATFGSYDAIRNRLLTIESSCESLIASRQETLTGQRSNLSLPVEAPDVPTYLYADLEITYPLLASIADIISVGKTLQSRVEHGMAYAN